MNRLFASGILLATLNAQGAVLMCAGVGSDERRELTAVAREANMELEFFVASQGGSYIADVDVSLTPVGSAEPALTLKADGPICFLNVPPGKYRVEASYKGAKTVATATVSAKPGSPVHLAMAFPGYVAEPDPAPPSLEEKLQASKP